VGQPEAGLEILAEALALTAETEERCWEAEPRTPKPYWRSSEVNTVRGCVAHFIYRLSEVCSSAGRIVKTAFSQAATP
jgi:hypothetical protein